MKTYHGWRDPNGVAHVQILDPPKPARLLPLRLDLFNHSLNGFEWGVRCQGAKDNSSLTSSSPFRSRPTDAASPAARSSAVGNTDALASTSKGRAIASIAASSSNPAATSDGNIAARDASELAPAPKSDLNVLSSNERLVAVAIDADTINAPQPSNSITSTAANPDKADGQSTIKKSEKFQRDLSSFAPTAISKNTTRTPENDDGPAQLALAILADVLVNDDERAVRRHQPFKRAVIARLDQKQNWWLTETAVRTALDDIEKTRAVI